ncbi:hypothetical protein [Acutalibacter intestini]|uniref:hypothetical protein n=1 Tax=Acutalibacter intestini TaxID=3093659 RepID=UPI002AC96CE5|nr:hypothetical protein [Acutalibacter sp. M00204]
MKRVVSIVLVLALLVQLWGCGTISSGSSTDLQDSTISALQDEVSRLTQENKNPRNQQQEWEKNSQVIELTPSPSSEKEPTPDIQIYDDEFLTIYYRRCQRDEYGDEDIVFYIDNKYDQGLAIMASSLSLDRENVNVGWNESIAAHSRGELKLSVDDDSSLPTLTPSTITMSGRAFTDSGWDTVTEFNIVDAQLAVNSNEQKDSTPNESSQSDVSETYSAFMDASSLSVDNLNINSSLGFAMYSHNGLLLDTETVEQFKNTSYLQGVKLNAGMMYDSLARSLEEYSETYPDGYKESYGIDFWTAYGNVCTVLWGIEKTSDNPAVRMRFLKSGLLFIDGDQALIGIISRLSECTTIQGNFPTKSEFEEGNMCSFEIPDLSATAWELEITETALGYILAKIADYTEDYEFADNFFKCNIPVRNYSFANS